MNDSIPSKSPDPFPFFVCCPRSGSTLLRAMLNNHSDLHVPPESHFIPRWFAPTSETFSLDTFQDFLKRHPRFEKWDLDPALLAQVDPKPDNPADAFRALYRIYAGRRGKTRYGDKTPGYALQIRGLARMFPEAVFVHLLRDGRDVALSLLEASFGPETLEDAASYWTDRVTAARRDGQALDPARYLEIRYEDLVRDPAAQLQRICAIARLPFQPAMLQHQKQAVDVICSSTQPEAHRNVSRPVAARRSWRNQMSAEDLRRFEAACGGVLAAFEY